MATSKTSGKDRPMPQQLRCHLGCLDWILECLVSFLAPLPTPVSANVHPGGSRRWPRWVSLYHLHEGPRLKSTLLQPGTTLVVGEIQELKISVALFPSNNSNNICKGLGQPCSTKVQNVYFEVRSRVDLGLANYQIV